ncbi:MAG: hypothetical protein WD740_02735 [Anaerolineales bacterium]
MAELLLEAYQNASVRIDMPLQAAPKAGQFIQAWTPHDELAVVPISLFATTPPERRPGTEISFSCLAELPESWQPGTELLLHGPLGRGFELPRRSQRVALAALGSSPGRLLPLVQPALQQRAEVVLCCDAQVRELPLAVEVRSLDFLVEALRWADFVAVDAPLEELDTLSGLLSRIPRAISGQALVFSPMPCGGMAQCGVCSLTTRSGVRLACEDGPVLELSQLVS